jgi:hypothetical protein
MLARVAVRSFDEALELLRRERVLALTHVDGVPSLVDEVIGKVRGSWWGHPKGNLVYSIASQLEDCGEALGAKVASGKVAFVHRSLWPALFRVATDPERRRQAERRLVPAARDLLARVERDRAVRLEGRAPERRELEKRLLVLSSSEHTASGRHAVVLRSWDDWAEADVRQRAAALPLDDARAELRRAGIAI